MNKKTAFLLMLIIGGALFSGCNSLSTSPVSILEHPTLVSTIGTHSMATFTLMPLNFRATLTPVLPTLTDIAIPTMTSISTATSITSCPGAPPSMLSVGDTVIVSLKPSLPVRVREQPTLSGRYLGQIYPDEVVTVTNGFRCSDGYTWWEITTAQKMVGWAIEGDQEFYWLIKKAEKKTGLIAYYPFDGDAVDHSGLGNDGKIYGATLTSDRNGKLNSAFEFNGINSYIYVKDNVSLKLTKKLTIAAWIETSETVPFAGIIIKANPVEPRSGYGLWINDNQKLRADVIWDHSASIGAVIVSNQDITDGKWHFVTVTYDGQIMSLYIDGILNGTKAYEQGAKENEEPLLIGWDQNTWLSTRHYKGNIDDVQLYNRVLNAGEILLLMGEN